MRNVPISEHVRLMQMITGKWLSRPIHAAVELGIPELIAGGPEGVDELAEMTGTMPDLLYRMMRALASVGIFEEVEDRRFGLTSMASLLRDDALGPVAGMFNAPWNDTAWMYFLDCLRSGETPFEAAHGMPLERWLADNPAAADVLMRANGVKAAYSHSCIVDAYDFGAAGTVVDVGGGNGSLILEILGSNPGLTGIVAEIPSVALSAGKLVRKAGMQERCRAVECDFFEDVPEGGDIYILSNILHDWDDAACIRILDNCFAARGEGTRLLVVEAIVPPGNEPSVAKLLDLEMFVVTGGRERTGEEYSLLLESAGYEVIRIIPTGGTVSIIESVCQPR